MARRTVKPEPQHPVVVDDENIAAALGDDDDLAPDDAALADAADEAMAQRAAGVDPAPDDPNAWRGESRLAASFMAHKIFPNWNIPADIQEGWAEAVRECANDLFPGGLGNVDKWGPWAKLMFASIAWAMVGFDMEKFAFKPLTPPPPAKIVPIRSASPSAPGDDPSPPAGGGFSSSA